MAVTEKGTLWACSRADYGKLGLDDDEGARVGRCHSLPPQLALAFAMGTHTRLGSAEAEAAAPAGGSRRSKRMQGKAAGADKNKGCAHGFRDDAGRSGEAGGGDVQVVAGRGQRIWRGPRGWCG